MFPAQQARRRQRAQVEGACDILLMKSLTIIRWQRSHIGGVTTSCQWFYTNPVWQSLQIEEAYDILLMESLKRRRTGEADVARSVRFADVPQPKKKQVSAYPAAPVTAEPTCIAKSKLWRDHRLSMRLWRRMAQSR